MCETPRMHQSSYESALNCHILPQWSGRDMDAISVADIESWLDSFDRPGAARKAYAVFRAILRLAFKRGLSDNDVTRREIRLPHLRHYEPQVLSAPEVRRLLKGFYGHPLEAWLLVSVCAGLRRCESVGVEWADLDLRRGTVTVKRSVQWVAGHETVHRTEDRSEPTNRRAATVRGQTLGGTTPRHEGWPAGRQPEREPSGKPLPQLVQANETPLRASTQPTPHVRHVGDQGRNRHQRGRTAARTLRHPNHRTVLPQA